MSIVEDACERLRAEMLAIFGADLFAIVVYGSWIFEPGQPLGDLDVHTILTEPAAMTTERRQRYLDAIAAIEADSGLEIDGWALAGSELDEPEPRSLIEPPAREGSWALHRAHWLAGRCKVLHGPAIAEWVTPPGTDEIESALRNELAFCVRAAGSSPADWPSVNAYIIRNCCRILASVTTGDPVLSKSEAVRWAMQNLPIERHASVAAAERVATGAADAAERELVSMSAGSFLGFTRRELGWTPRLQIEGVSGLPEVREGADLAEMICARTELRHRDVIVVAQKIISKSEGRVVQAADADAKRRAVADETRRVVARRDEIVISETRQGFVCANAGVDASNAEAGTLILLPVDPDASAEKIRQGIRELTGAQVGVIVSDTFGRPWRTGQTDVAIGVAGLAPIDDLRGTIDRSGRELEATMIATADELAGAAELAMGKAEGVPVVRIRGLWTLGDPGSGRDLIRPATEDLFPTGIGGEGPSTPAS
ncbi:MAG: coenzyme F420-0:L-glutamate ligase [Actinomycetota bacterium]